MVLWVVASILHGYGVDPLSYFSFQPVLHDWRNKGCGMSYPDCGMVHIRKKTSNFFRGTGYRIVSFLLEVKCGISMTSCITAV